MESTDLFNSPPWVSAKTWAKIKSGAAVAGLALGTVAICAISTFACAYAQGFGHSKGTREGRLGPTSTRPDNDRDYSGSSSFGGGFRRSVLDRDEAA